LYSTVVIVPLLRREVEEFVDACEAIIALLARGETLTGEERDLVEFWAIDVLSKVSPE
jgi:hypothetical protein